MRYGTENRKEKQSDLFFSEKKIIGKMYYFILYLYAAITHSFQLEYRCGNAENKWTKLIQKRTYNTILQKLRSPLVRFTAIKTQN